MRKLPRDGNSASYSSVIKIKPVCVCVRKGRDASAIKQREWLLDNRSLRKCVVFQKTGKGWDISAQTCEKGKKTAKKSKRHDDKL